MKKFVFIHGPNGIGKSTVCELLNKKVLKSAWLESEWARCINPFILNPEIELLTEKNITFLLRSYLECSEVDTVIFNWGFHGSRKAIYERVLNNISDIQFQYLPITLLCNEEENIKRMKLDNRSDERIARALQTRHIYEDLTCSSIDTTLLTPEETLMKIIEFIGM